METLSENLLAQELIRANRQAEAAENERLKAQSQHYEEEINVLRDQADRNMEAIANLHEKLDHVGDQTVEHLKAQKEQSAHYVEEINVLRDQADRNMEAIANLHDKLDHVGDQMSGNTHDTGVRIYRNVQAVIKDESDKQTKELTIQMEALSDRLDTLDKKMEESAQNKDKNPFSLIMVAGVILILLLTVLMFMGYNF